MSTPVLESIALALVDLINGITTANGYHYDLTAVRPTTSTITDNHLADLNVIVSQGDPGNDELCDDEITWGQPFYLAAVVFEDAEVLDFKINKIRSDIEKAIGLANDAAVAGKRLTGLADDLRLNPPMHVDYGTDSGALIPGIIVSVTVDYTVKANDPYTVA